VDVIRFKYKPLNLNGQETGLFSKKGELRPEALILDKTPIPLPAVAKTVRRNNRLILVVATQNDPVTLAIAITKGRAETLKETIDQLCSARWAKAREERLSAAGKIQAFRSETCPYCRSIVDLSGFDPTPQMYCPFCETVVTVGPGAPRDEKTYRFCDQCGYYGQPKPFTTFYFIFLIAAVYYRYRTTTRCNACMRSEAWKMVLGNGLFILGLPFALVQLGRAYLGGSTFSSTFSGLDGANSASRRGRPEKAEATYEAILARAGRAAGIRYNQALSQLGKEPARAAVLAHAALKECSNYSPAAELTIQALSKMGRKEEAEAFKKLWGGGSPSYLRGRTGSSRGRGGGPSDSWAKSASLRS
jgi:hypothetical protein